MRASSSLQSCFAATTPPTADTLEGAIATHQPAVALTMPDRMAILDVLLDAPPGLQELRAVLLAEHVGRKRDGLAEPNADPARPRRTPEHGEQGLQRNWRREPATPRWAEGMV